MSTDPVRVVTTPLPSSFPRDVFGDRVAIEVAQTNEELRTLAREAEVLYSWRVPETVPDETPSLKWVHLPSAGADHIHGLPIWSSDILITASMGIHAVPMSEHFLAMLLALSRQVPAMVRNQQTKTWQHQQRSSPLRVRELRGQTLGIVGWGKIGDAVARLARALGMRVIGTRWSVVVATEVGRDVDDYDEEFLPGASRMGPDIVYPSAQLHEVLGQSDAIVVLLPLTEQTEGLFGPAEFAAMKRGSLFFNLGRGKVVDEEALIRSLQSGRLGGAGLDVFSQEPLPPSSPLWTMSSVIVSPHLGGVGDRTRERAADFFAVNLDRYLRGEHLFNAVERERGY